jgi:hypothetical protein
MTTISLVIVDTDTHVLANEAVQRSIRDFKFDKILAFSDDINIWNNASVIKIPKLKSIKDYNNLIVNSLPDYITTDYFIVIQFDGFIINASQWANLFLHYDYIGAPWPSYNHGPMNVGNGGFSLRSKKLAEIVRSYQFDANDPEDIHICQKLRPELENKHKLNFPHESIASHFSAESYIYRYPTFGFHNIRFLPLIYKDNLDFLLDNLSDRIVKSHFNNLMSNLKNISTNHAQKLLIRYTALNNS